MNSSTKASEARPAIRSLALLLAALAAAPRAADVVITSQSKGEEVISLGFVDFTARKPDPNAQGPAAVIANDLGFSGRFKLANAPRFDSAAAKAFKDAGALAYVTGDYLVDGDKFEFQAQLLDLQTKEQILGKKYAGKKAELRVAAHRFSDELVWQLFGEKGIAQTKVAYICKRGGNKEVNLMDYDGANVIEVTNNRSINLLPCWIEGQAKLLFTSYLSGFPQFYLKDLGTGKAAVFSPSKGMNTAASYDKIDKEIAFVSTMDGNSEIYRRPVGEGKPTRLTFSQSIDASPSWSPNGYEIAFISDRSGKPMVYVMDRDGSNVRRITYEGDYMGSPAWSPKGDRIAFSSMGANNNFDIFTISPDGKDLKQLTANAGSNEGPSWSPDGRHIAFSSTRTGGSEIWMMRADGSDQKRISFSGANTMPRWSDIP